MRVAVVVTVVVAVVLSWMEIVGGAPPELAVASNVVIGSFFTFLFSMLRKKPVLTRLGAGVRLLNRGRYSEALTNFEAERAVAPRDPVVLFDCGITRLQLWQLDRAHGLLEDAWRLRKLSGNQQVLNALVPEHLALVSALRNDAAKANEWLALVPAADADPARNALVNGVLAAHARDWARARQLLGPFEVKQLGGVFGGLVRAVDALCIERLTGEVRHLDRVALYGETGPEELRKVWPEFVEFVDRSPAW